MKPALRERIHAESGPLWQLVQGDGFLLHVDHDEGDELSLAESVARTLGNQPRWLHFRWLYDVTGSQIYERITEQPEYYLTRAEDRILAANAPMLRDLVGDVSLVELGSGSSVKTRRLLDAWSARGSACYVPIDISRSAIEQACGELARVYPGLAIEGMVARYARALPLVGEVSPLLLLFLGSSIGNFDDRELDAFLDLAARSLQPGDGFLLGIDLVKDRSVLEAAYNDAAGWTARFMLNLLTRLNRELGTDIPPEAVSYEGHYDEQRERVEMYLRFQRDVTVAGAGLPQPIEIAAGETVMVEISRKFRIDAMVDRLRAYGFSLRRTFTDADGYFAVLLLTRTV